MVAPSWAPTGAPATPQWTSHFPLRGRAGCGPWWGPGWVRTVWEVWEKPGSGRRAVGLVGGPLRPLLPAWVRVGRGGQQFLHLALTSL